MSWRPTAAREDPCFVCLLLSFYFSSHSLFLRLLLCFCSGPMRTHPPTLRCHDCSLQTAYHRGGRACFERFDIYLVYVKRFIPFIFWLLFSSRSLCRTACNLLVSSGSRGGGAESHTYSPHDARSIRIRALRFRQWTSSIPLALFIHSACQPLEARRNGSET
jgi:hypothetical protein